jgi:hypothetical protein
MRLHVKITPLRPGTAESAGRPEMLRCPAGVEPDTVQSFLIQHFGEPIEVAWTTTERHERVDLGWIFRAPPEVETEAEVMCVPFIDIGDGPLRPMFELLADQRQDFEHLAATGDLDALTVIEAPPRRYAPGADGHTSQIIVEDRDWDL